MQSFKYRRKTAVAWKKRGNTDGAQRLCSQRRTVAGILFIATRDVSAYLYVTLGSHIYTDYHCEQKELLRRALMTEETRNPPTSVFVGHAYVQYGRSEWRGVYCVRYNTYLISETQNLLDATVLNMDTKFLLVLERAPFPWKE